MYLASREAARRTTNSGVLEKTVKEGVGIARERSLGVGGAVQFYVAFAQVRRLQLDQTHDLEAATAAIALLRASRSASARDLSMYEGDGALMHLTDRLLVEALAEYELWRMKGGRRSPGCAGMLLRLSTHHDDYIRVQAMLALIKIDLRLSEVTSNERKRASLDLRAEVRIAALLEASFRDPVVTRARLEATHLALREESATAALAQLSLARSPRPMPGTEGLALVRFQALARKVSSASSRGAFDAACAALSGLDLKNTSVASQLEVLASVSRMWSVWDGGRGRVGQVGSMPHASDRGSPALHRTDPLMQPVLALWSWADESLPPAITEGVAEYFLRCHESAPSVAYAKNAGTYAWLAFNHTPPDDPARVARVRLALHALQQRLMYLHEPLPALVALLDDVDGLIGRRHPQRPAVLASLGQAASALVARGQADTALVDRCAAYWEEHLRHQRREQPEDWVLAFAYENAAVAQNLRARWAYSRNDERKARRALKSARRHAERAFAIAGHEHDPRTPMTLAWVLYLGNAWFGLASRGEAINLQTEAIEKYRHRLLSDSIRKEFRDPVGLLDMVFHPNPEQHPQAAEQLTWLYELASSVEDHPQVAKYLSGAYCGADFCLRAGQPALALVIAERALSRAQAIKPMGKADDWHVLDLTQGLGSLGAVAAAQIGRDARAVEVLELGTAQRAKLHAGANAAPSWNVISTTARTCGVPLAYIAATPVGGIAILVDGSGLQTVMLPRLTSRWATERLDELSGQRPAKYDDRNSRNYWLMDPQPSLAGRGGTQEFIANARVRGGAHTVRGPRGATSPDPETVTGVLRQASEVITPLRDLLASWPAPTGIHLIPVGVVGGLPWSAVLEGSSEDFAVSVNASAAMLVTRAHHPQHEQAQASFALVDPRATVLGGEVFPALEGAAAEGLWLEEEYGVVLRRGPDATLEEFRSALARPRRFVHLGGHGHFDPQASESATLLWAAPDGEDSPRATLDSIRDVQVGLVFLGCCWGGAPTRDLPDEAMSFPTAFIHAGADVVVAPLWPVGDADTQTIVAAFYTSWLEEGLSPAEALKFARQDARESFVGDGSTWAAFSVSGSGAFRRAETSGP